MQRSTCLVYWYFSSFAFRSLLAKCCFRSGFLHQMSFSQGSATFRFLFWVYISLLFLDLLFVRFFCRRLFAKFFDLRSGLSVSLPFRSVGTPSPPPRESGFFNPRNNLEPCTDSLELRRRICHRRKSEQRTFG